MTKVRKWLGNGESQSGLKHSEDDEGDGGPGVIMDVQRK